MGWSTLDRNKHIVRFKDLVFRPHPKASFIFTSQAIVTTYNNHRISIVGPRKNIFGDIDLPIVGKYEILYSLWEEPSGYLTEEEVDTILIKLQSGPLDLIPEIEKHKFIK